MPSVGTRTGGSSGEGPGIFGVDPRYARAKAEYEALMASAPLVAAMHDRYPEAIEEEVELLDLDLAGSVTVVEWGENLAEGLAPSFLEIAITPRAAAPAAAEAGPDGDEPRTLRVTGWGTRWELAAAAARTALSGTP